MAKTSLLSAFASLIFPVDCAVCSRESNWLCQDCLKQYQKVRLSNCFICGNVAVTGICGACSNKTAIDGIVSIFPYGNPAIRSLIQQAKYRGGRDALEFLADNFRSKIFRLLPAEAELITFTPSTKPKEKERGYNPAEVFARCLAEGETRVVPLFVKVKHTASQTKLNKRKRLKNVRGAYALTKKELPETLVIVDDVITTGATLGALTKLAKRRGVKNVWAATICHG